MIKFLFISNFFSNLLNICLEMESNQNENVILINDENEMCFNEWNIQDFNGIFQTKQKTIEEIIEPNKRNEMETKL